VQHGKVTNERVREVADAEGFEGGRFAEAREVFELVALADEFVEFLTLPAYDYID
jgi:malate synthase